MILLYRYSRQVLIVATMLLSMLHAMKSVQANTVQAVKDEQVISNEQWIIHFKDEYKPLLRTELKQVFPQFDFKFQMFNQAWVVKVASNTDIKAALHDFRISEIEPDLMLQPLLVPNDSRYNQQWAHFETAGGTNVQEAHDYSLGEDTTIAVLDTGYIVHPDLNINRLPGADLVDDAANARDGNGRDHNAIDEGDYSDLGDCTTNPLPSSSSWHGSHVAGISSAIMDNGVGVVGVAPRSQHMHLRVLARCGGRISDIADGIAWVAGVPVAGLKPNTRRVDVINMSLGGTGACSSSLQSAINVAVNRNITVVVAAGNDDRDAVLSTPANCNNVITVAATGRDGGKASYSNFGDVVDIAAPGGGNGGAILSTVDGGSQGRSGPAYAGYNGTSMATPHVAGVIALLKSVEPDLSPSQIKQLLEDTARPFTATCNQCGAGIVDPTKALIAIGATLRGYQQTSSNGRYQYGGDRYTAITDGTSFFRINVLNGVTTVSLEDLPAGRNNLVEIKIRHNAFSQLSVSITPPDGSRQTLQMVERRGNLATYRLNLSQSTAGDYDLRITDDQAGGRGHITSFTIFQDENR